MHCDWVPHCFTSRSTDLLDTTYHASDAPEETVKDGHTSIKGAHKKLVSEILIKAWCRFSRPYIVLRKGDRTEHDQKQKKLLPEKSQLA